jgi:anti-sigma regulatory factor (Ser/Thr protein kinase)
VTRVDVSGAVVWRAEGEAERVLGLRPMFRERIRALPHCDADSAELIYGELLANVVRHARGAVEVRLELHCGRPVLVVRDHGPGLRRLPSPVGRDPFAESGRGLAIVRRLSQELAVRAAPGGGTMVVAVLPEQTEAA